jgi:hypothetical protein
MVAYTMGSLVERLAGGGPHKKKKKKRAVPTKKCLIFLCTDGGGITARIFRSRFSAGIKGQKL